MKIEGFKELERTLEALGQVGNKIGKRAIKKGLNLTLEQLKKDAPKSGGKSSLGIPIKSGGAAKHLRVVGMKAYKGGSIYGQCGIDKGNWAETKQLWFQHFGYENHGLNFSGEPITKNVGWFTEAWRKIKSKAAAEVEKEIQNEIKRVLK